MMYKRSAFFVAGTAAILGCCISAAALANQDDWDTHMTSGNVLAEQGRLTEAEQHYLAAVKDAGSPTPIDTRLAATLNNLGTLYHRMSRYSDAESAYQQSLASLEQQLGATHPLLAAGLNNLAWLYTATTRYDHAESLYQRSLLIAEQAFGADDPVLAQILTNQAILLEAQSRYGEAERAHQRLLAIVEKALGPDHPDVATGLENYAQLLRKTHRDIEAGSTEDRAKAIQKRLGLDNGEAAHDGASCRQDTHI